MGNTISECRRVGNFILGGSVFDTEDPLHSVEPQCKTGHVEGRCITIISALHLFDQTLSHHQLTLGIKGCASLSDPGPHVIMIIVQPESFTEEDKTRLEKILSYLSEEAHKYAIILITENIEIGASVDLVEESIIQKITAEYNYRHLNFRKYNWADLVHWVEEIVKENKGSLNCEIFEELEETKEMEAFAQTKQKHKEPDEFEKHFCTKNLHPSGKFPPHHHN